jgi:hypothetical protein
MESICDDPDCTNIINKHPTKEGIPKLMAEIRPNAIDNILAENVETFHVHQYGSMVIFLEYLEGLDPSDEMIDEYSKQGHVFLLPMKPFDLVSLRDKKIKQITYKASDSKKVWYRITIVLKSKSVGNKLKNLFH